MYRFYRRVLSVSLLLVFLPVCQRPVVAAEENPMQAEAWAKADDNGEAARKTYLHCRDYVRGWLGHADAKTGLIPRNLMGNTYWNGKDAAADNYPFMVLTASLLDEELYRGRLRDILRTERRLCSRVGGLPDDYEFATQTFRNEKIELPQIIFGASEYVKDGLLPLTEWLGQSPWMDRAIELTDAIIAHAEVESPVGPLPHVSHEVAGELLQVLSRFYWVTKKESYREMVFRLTDYFFFHASPLKSERLKLRDHGCEVIGGLSEGYYLAAKTDPPRYETYREPMHKILDRILEIGRNQDGLFYNSVEPVQGKVLQENLSDNWGYNYNAFLTVAEIDNHEPYREAVRFALSNIHKYKDYDWERGGSADGYADSIESALNLLNRYPDPRAFEWVEYSMGLMLAIQRDDGIIEGWHGDGNYARTAVMYALWKSKGTRGMPWRGDLRVGAECVPQKNGTEELWVSVRSDWAWQGRLVFDGPRHREVFGLPTDYPRLNQFPEWSTIDRASDYVLDYGDGKPVEKKGSELLAGLPIQTERDQTLRIRVRKK